MIARLLNSRAVLLAVGAIIVFVLSLLFAGHRLIQIERSINYYIGEDMLYATAQAQYESVRFVDALTRFGIGDGSISREDFDLRYDILKSRLNLFSEGEPRRYLVNVGVQEEFERRVTVFTALEPRILALVPGDRANAYRLREDVVLLASFLRDTVNRTMLAERDRNSALRTMRRETLVEILGYMAGIMGSGLLLAFLIVRSWREIARASASLRRERELSRIYRAFLSMVSHQFRTPLAIIDSGAQRMRQRGTAMTEDEIGTRANKIRDAVARLVRLMESTLNAARFDEGEISCNPRAANLAAIINGVCERLQELEQDRPLTVEVSNLPREVSCDPTLIEQAFANVVSNALKYSDRTAPVHVRGWVVSDMVLISVEDHGVGIPEDELAQVFEHFFRARTAERIEGTGIGLSFARHIIRLHGGDIDVVSTVGHGSTFTIRLPLSAAEEAHAGGFPASLSVLGDPAR